MRHARARKASLKNFGWLLALWVIGSLIVGVLIGLGITGLLRGFAW